MKHKVIIIGAGVAGLATAIALAREGYKVSIFEKNPEAGGRCGVIRRDGHRFDLGATIFLMPLFDVRLAASSCAVFSYLVHIMRDFVKDQRSNLMYYADDLMQKHGLNRDMLQQMAQGDPLCKGFRNMMTDYCEIAEQYRIKTQDTLQRIKPLMEPASQLSLDIIFNLYLMVYERIDCKKGTFSTKELNPTAAEIKKRVLETIQKNNFIN